jgi:hypothetical protein
LAAATPKRLILAVIDGMNPAAVTDAVAAGRAPVLAAVIERGTFVPGAIAAFPSVTPVCATAIATGVRQDRHGIPGMNWYHRDEQRYVEYGSSLRAARRVGIARQLLDLVYEMNMSHLSSTTVFEALDDHGVRTAGTTYLIYRGRHEQQVSRRGGLTRLARTIMREPVLGPRELFYADIFESRPTECRSQLGLPGVRDRHAGCVGSELVTGDLFDFLLLSLPDNDSYSHKRGPEAQITSIAHADRQLMRIAQAAGGLDEFLDRYALIATADHGHAPVRARAELRAPFDNLGVLEPTTSGNGDPHALVALCPSQRYAMVYVLDPDRRERLVPDLVRRARTMAGVDLVMHRDGAEGVIAAAGGRAGELRFAPGGDLVDARGRRWSIEGDLGVIAAEVHDGLIDSDEYPDPLARVWSALTCAQSGEVLLSAADGLEFPDWGGAAHVGGGSHGSLHRSDSLGALMFCGVQPPPGFPRGGVWAIEDVANLCCAHFGVGTLSADG